MKGKKLIDSITAATGLPQKLIDKELKLLIEKSGFDINNINMEELRVVISQYLQEVLLNAKTELTPK